MIPWKNLIRITKWGTKSAQNGLISAVIGLPNVFRILVYLQEEEDINGTRRRFYNYKIGPKKVSHINIYYKHIFGRTFMLRQLHKAKMSSGDRPTISPALTTVHRVTSMKSARKLMTLVKNELFTVQDNGLPKISRWMRGVFVKA